MNNDSLYTNNIDKDYDFLQNLNVKSIVSVSELIKQSVSVYPNPASDILFIKTIEQKVNYKLWTQSGTQVGEGMVSDKIDISKLFLHSVRE